jgi:hypothetical protein
MSLLLLLLLSSSTLVSHIIIPFSSTFGIILHVLIRTEDNWVIPQWGAPIPQQLQKVFGFSL